MDIILNNQYNEPPVYEIINGETVKMSSPKWNHFVVSRNLELYLHSVFKNKECTYFQDFNVFLGEHHLIPDLGIVCDLSKIHDNGIYGAPDLVAEILSKSTARYDLGSKKDIYQEYHVKEYWTIDISNKSVSIYTLNINNLYKLASYYVILDEMEQKNYEGYTTLVKSTIFPEIEIELDEVFEGCR